MTTDLNNPISVVEERIEAFRDISSERSAALIELSSRMRAAWSDQQSAQARLRDLERDGLKDDNPAVLAARREVNRADQDRAKLAVQIEKARPGAEWAQRLSLNVEAYVRAHGADGLAAYKGATPQLRDGEKAADALARATGRVRELLAERQRVAAAPYPASHAKAIARKQLAALAAAAAPDVSPVIDRGEPIRFPQMSSAIRQYGSSTVDLAAVDPIGTLVWLFKSEFEAAIDREIDANSQDEIALTAEQRAAKLAEIDRDILASERELVAFAALTGQLPPPDCDPRALLELADTMPAPERD